MIVRRLSRMLLVLCTIMTIQVTSAQTQPSVTDSMNNIFSLAESKLSEYFPAGSVTQFFDNYVYRFYESTGVHLAFDENNVYLLGGGFGDTVINIGSIPSIEGTLIAYQEAIANGDVWNLRVSGSASFFGQSMVIPEILLEGIPAPDVTNTDEINASLDENLAGVVTDIGTVSVIIVDNSENLRTIDVSFSATANGVAASYDLRLSFTR